MALAWLFQRQQPADAQQAAIAIGISLIGANAP